MAKLKDFFRSKSGKITISIIAAIVVAASIGAIITIKHKKIDNNKIAETKKEQTLDTEKRDEAIKEAEAEKELEKAKYSGNKEEIEKAKAKVSKAREKAEKVQNKTKGTKSTNSSANQKNSANKSSKASERRPGKPNKPNKPSKPGKKETLTQEIARLKKWVWESTPNAVFLPKQYSENDDYEADVEAYARSKGVRSYGYSEIKLSNGKYIPYFWKH